MTLRLLVAVLAVASFAQLSPQARADLLFDDFNSPSPGRIYQISLLNSNPYTSPTDTVAAGVDRTITVAVTTPIPPNFNSASGTIGGGTFSLATDDTTKANTTIRYDLSGAARNLSLLAGVDIRFNRLDSGLIDNGNNTTSNATSIPVVISIATATGTLTRTTSIPGGTNPFTASFNRSSFTGTGDLSQTNSISILLNGGQTSRFASDFTIDSIKVRAVPAPPAVLLAGIGALALLGRARFTRRPAAAA